MSDYIFAHGGRLECPECPGAGKGKRKPLLICVERNYSGCSVDMGQCEECGKAWEISFKVKEIVRQEGWDGESRSEREAAQEREKAEAENRERAELARLKNRYEGPSSVVERGTDAKPE